MTHKYKCIKNKLYGKFGTPRRIWEKNEYVCMKVYGDYDPILFEVGKKYYIEIDKVHTPPTVIYCDDKNTDPTEYKFSCAYNKIEFDECFIPIIEYRKNKIEEILK